jgi:hypothetical protein
MFDSIEIHIQDLVDCAKAGKWTKKLSSDFRARGIIRGNYAVYAAGLLREERAREVRGQHYLLGYKLAR